MQGDTEELRPGAKIRALLVLVTAVLFAGLSSFAALSIRSARLQALALDDLPTTEPNPAVQPEEFTFIIWGVIWAGLIGMALFGLFRRAEDPSWDQGRMSLIGSMGAGAMWLWAGFAGSPLLAAAMIFVMLTLALWALPLSRVPDDPWLSLPVGLYAGWLTVAGFVAVGMVMAGYGMLPSTRVAAWVIIPIALKVAWLVVRSYKPAVSYPVAVAWGFFGIVASNLDRNPEIPILAMLASLALAWHWWRVQTAPPAANQTFDPQ